MNTASFTQTTPGYCYLALFRDDCHAHYAHALGAFPARGKVEAIFQLPEPAIYDGYLRLTFGTPSSRQHSQKYQCHVDRVPATESLLRARDVVAAMPPGSRYGALPADDDTAAPIDNSVALAPNLAALGGLTDPTRRRFFVSASSVALPAKFGTMHVSSITPASLGPIQQYIAYSGYAAFSTLHVHLVPGFASVACLTRVHSAWHPETENAPNTLSAFSASPTHQVTCLGPSSPGGVPSSVILACPMEYGIQRVVKPPGERRSEATGQGSAEQERSKIVRRARRRRSNKAAERRRRRERATNVKERSWDGTFGSRMGTRRTSKGGKENKRAGGRELS